MTKLPIRHTHTQLLCTHRTVWLPPHEQTSTFFIKLLLSTMKTVLSNLKSIHPHVLYTYHTLHLQSSNPITITIQFVAYTHHIHTNSQHALLHIEILQPDRASAHLVQLSYRRICPAGQKTKEHVYMNRLGSL